MTDVPSKHVWKIKESRIVFKDFEIIEMQSSAGSYAMLKCIFSRYGMHAVVFRVFGIHSERYA